MPRYARSRHLNSQDNYFCAVINCKKELSVTDHKTCRCRDSCTK